MSANKNIDRICIIITICALILTVLFMNGQRLGINAIVDEDAEGYEGNEYFTANDMNGTYSTEDATVITLSGDTASFNGEGVYVYDGSVYITNGGVYLCSGTLNEGSIVIDAYNSSKVYLMFDGVDINCSDNAGVIVKQADKVFLTLKEGSENSITCGDTYSDEALADEINGAIFSHDDLTINGSGSLTVTAGYKHGITSKDDLIITGGSISVTAAADGLRANDNLRIMAADITVDAKDDGLVINKEGGSLYIESGNINIISADDGIHSAGDVGIAGGSLTIEAADDGIHSDTAFTISDGVILITECYEGIEAVTIDIAGGDTTIYPEDDGLNANGGSGNMFGMGMGMGMNHGDKAGSDAEAADTKEADAAEADTVEPDMLGEARTDSAETVMEEEPDVAAGAAVSVSGSEEIKAAEESEESKESEEEETYVRITGGNLTIINESGRDADGIDSNGDITIEGGTIRVSLVNNGNNSALDYGMESGGVATISGGNIIATGNYSMAEQFDSSSSQASILYTYSAGAEAGTTVMLEDSEGNVILSYEVPQSFSSMNISCPEMKVGESYIVVIGDNVEEITIEEISASYGDAQSGGFGGNMNFGGMMSRGDFEGQRPEGQGGHMRRGERGSEEGGEASVS